MFCGQAALGFVFNFLCDRLIGCRSEAVRASVLDTPRCPEAAWTDETFGGHRQCVHGRHVGCGWMRPGRPRGFADRKHRSRLADNLWRSHDLGDRRPRDIRRFRAAGIADGGAAVPGGRPFDLETGSDEGQRVLEVKVASRGEEFKVVVAADGQQVVRQQQADKPSDDVAKAEGAKVDARRALQAAAGTDPGSTLSEMEIDTNYDGAVVWQVALVHRDGSTLQIDVDAKSAAISAR